MTSIVQLVRSDLYYRLDAGEWPTGISCGADALDALRAELQVPQYRLSPAVAGYLDGLPLSYSPDMPTNSWRIDCVTGSEK